MSELSEFSPKVYFRQEGPSGSPGTPEGVPPLPREVIESQLRAPEWSRDLFAELTISRSPKEARWWTRQILKGIRERGPGYVDRVLKDTVDAMAERHRPNVKPEVASLLNRQFHESETEKGLLQELDNTLDVVNRLVTFNEWWSTYYRAKGSLGAYAEMLTYSVTTEMVPQVFERIFNLDGFEGPTGNGKVGRWINLAMVGYLRVSLDKDKFLLKRVREGKGYQAFMFGDQKEEEEWVKRLKDKIYSFGHRDKGYLPNPYSEDVTPEEGDAIDGAIKELILASAGRKVSDINSIEEFELNEAVSYAKQLFFVLGLAPYHGVDKLVNEGGRIVDKEGKERTKKGPAELTTVICEGFPSSDASIDVFNPQDKIRDKARRKDMPWVITSPDDFPARFATHFLRRVSLTNPEIDPQVVKEEKELTRKSLWELWVDGGWDGKPKSLGELPWRKLADEEWRSYFLRIFLVGRSPKESPEAAGVMHFYLGSSWRAKPDLLKDAFYFAELRRFIGYVFNAPLLADGEWSKFLVGLRDRGVAPEDMEKAVNEDVRKFQESSRETIFALMYRTHRNLIEQSAWKSSISVALFQSRFFGETETENKVENILKRPRVQQIINRLRAY